jgi:hypothetical protein
MADKKIKVQVDVETDVEPSLAQLRLLKKQLKETAAGSQEFIALQRQIDDVQDSLVSARAGAGNFAEVLGTLPGPIGAIGGQIGGTVATLKQFSAIKLTNLQASFSELGADLVDVARGFGNLTGITKVYTVLNTALARSFVAVGVGEAAAAAGAKAFAAALTATGIGAIVVALGLLIANWDKVVDAIKGATAESKTYEEAQASVTKELTTFNQKLIEVRGSFEAAKQGTISKEDALKKYNETLGSTVGYAGSLEQAEALLAANTKVVIESIKLRTQAQVFYAKSAEAAAKAVSGEDVEPTFWQTVGDYIKTAGNYTGFVIAQAETYGENLSELRKNQSVFEKEGDELTRKAIENDKNLKKGLAKPPDFKPTVKATNNALDEIKKGFEDARLALLGEQERELEVIRLRYDKLVAQAKKYKKDTKILEEAREKENAAVRDKYAKQEADKKQKAIDDSKKKIADNLAYEEQQLTLKVAKAEITEDEYQNKLFELRKNAAIKTEALDNEVLKKQEDTFNTKRIAALANLQIGLQNEESTINSSYEKRLQDLDNLLANEKLAVDKSFQSKVSDLDASFQKETAVINSSYQKQLSELQTALQNRTITEEQFNAQKLSLQQQTDAQLLQSQTNYNTQKASLQSENDAEILWTETKFNTERLAIQTENDSALLEVKNKFNADSKVVQQAYQTDLDAVSAESLAKNKEFIDAQIELEKYKVEKKKELSESEREIVLSSLQTRLEALDAENGRVEFDFEQDLIRLGEQRNILAEQEAAELANTELTEFQKTEIRKKYADARKGITEQEIATERAANEAKHEINMAYLGLFEQFGNVLGQVAGKNKALAIAGVIIQQAASIGQIIASTGIANAKAVAASPLTFGMPWVAINTVSAGLSIAASVAGAVKSIQQINQAAAQGGVQGGGGGGTAAQSSPPPKPPTVSGAAAPQIQTSGGMNPTQQIGETINRSQAPIKAYVVSGDVSSAQALDRRTSRAATFTGG